VELRSEEFQFNLTLGGRPAGSQRLTTHFERGLFVMRLDAHFQGGLGSHKRSQVSRLALDSRLPTVFTENDNGRVFETTFDRRDGLVRVRQHRDEASIALTQDYQDPVSVLQFLRDLPDDVRSVRVPMVGGTVLVTRLEDETVDSPWGPRPARVYYLRPGVNLVYIELEAPHRILKLTQTVGRSALEASLSRFVEGPAAPVDAQPARGGGSRRERSDDTAQANTVRAKRAQRQEQRQERRLEGRQERGAQKAAAPKNNAPKPQSNVPAAEGTGESRSKRRRRNRAARLEGRSEERATVSAMPAKPVQAQPNPEPSGAAPAGDPTRKRRRRRRGGRSNSGNAGGGNGGAGS
jgi:hypothetical protein